MDIRTVRRENLVFLEHKFGGLESLAQATGTNAAVLSQIKNSYRNMGHSIARRIEVGIGETSGWMDLPQYEDDEAIAQAIKIVIRLPQQDREAWLRHGAALVHQIKGAFTGDGLVTEVETKNDLGTKTGEQRNRERRTRAKKKSQ